MKLKKIKVIAALLAAVAVPVGVFAGLAMMPAELLTREVSNYLHMLSASLFLLVPLVLLGFLMTMAIGKQATVCVSGGRLTVGQGVSEQFVLAGAEVRPYCTPYGTARGSVLYFRNESRDFVVGTNDVRVINGRLLEASPVSRLDAYLAPSDFAVLLGMVGLGHPSESPITASPAGIRCLLFPVRGLFAAIRLIGKPTGPSLAIELHGDTVSVIDPRTNAQLTSASRSEVTAKAVRYQRIRIPRGSPWAILLIRVPGIRPLRVGAPDIRFRWGEIMPRRRYPRYVVSPWDWLQLVEFFGLTSSLASDVPTLWDVDGTAR